MCNSYMYVLSLSQFGAEAKVESVALFSTGSIKRALKRTEQDLNKDLEREGVTKKKEEVCACLYL